MLKKLIILPVLLLICAVAAADIELWVKILLIAFWALYCIKKLFGFKTL